MEQTGFWYADAGTQNKAGLSMNKKAARNAAVGGHVSASWKKKGLAMTGKTEFDSQDVIVDELLKLFADSKSTVWLSAQKANKRALQLAGSW